MGSLADEKLRAYRAYVVPTVAEAAFESLSDVERKYYWMKIGQPLPVDPTVDTITLKRLYWAGGNFPQYDSDFLERQFYFSKGISLGKSLSDMALEYWSGQ